jgi:hypothetical protein
MAELFRAQHKPRSPPAPPKKIICPVCGQEHCQPDDECPVCGLRKQDRGNPEAVERERRIFLLPPDRKAAFREECEALLENPFGDFPAKIKKHREIFHKYGIE